MDAAAAHANVTRQAIYVAVKKGALKAEKVGNCWKITLKDLNEYRLNKYNRDKRMIDGELVFSLEKGEYSVQQVSKILSHEIKAPFPSQKVYYMVRTGKLPCLKKGSTYVILRKDLAEFVQREMDARGILKIVEEA